MTYPVSITTILTLIISLQGCSKPHNNVVPPSESSPATTLVNAPEQFHWTLASKPRVVSFLITDSSIVSVSTDTTKKELPFISNSIYRLSIVPGSSPGIQLHIDSTAVGNQALDLTATVSAQGQITNLEASQSASCKGGINPRFVRLFDLLASPPSSSIGIGSHWADTSTAIVCHGRTPLRQQIIHHYTLLRERLWQENHVLEIQRATQIEIEGLEVDSLNPITAKGSGSGITKLLIDPETGLVLQSSSTSDLSLSVITSRGIFPFQQHDTTKIIMQL
jgi:hypothetical protein